ncbi:hypothetical protein [Streptomyces sp. NPDC053079]|uniref:hypothetical protein n=1 Tax=Streptomyces sp. NPDC053079 TaxID=3365697 RepID=UPI0037D660E8
MIVFIAGTPRCAEVSGSGAAPMFLADLFCGFTCTMCVAEAGWVTFRCSEGISDPIC